MEGVWREKSGEEASGSDRRRNRVACCLLLPWRLPARRMFEHDGMRPTLARNCEQQELQTKEPGIRGGNTAITAAARRPSCQSRRKHPPSKGLQRARNALGRLERR